MTKLNISTHRIPGGPDVWCAEDHFVPLASLLWTVPAGADFDPPGTEGLAAFTVSLLRAGTARRSASILVRDLETLGADLFMGCGWQTASVGIECLSEDLDVALATLCEIAQSPSFPAAAVDRQRRWLGARLAHRRRQSSAIANEQILRALGGSARHTLPKAGTEESLAHLTPDDVRSFHERGYGVRRARLFAVGDFRTEKLLRQLEETTGPASAVPSRKTGGIERPKPTGRPILLVDSPTASRTELRVGTLGLSLTDADFLGLELLNGVLGGTASSRLARNLRHRRGFVYGVQSRILERSGLCPWVVSTTIAPGDVDSVVPEVLREFEDLQRQPISERELRAVQEHWIASASVACQTYHSVAREVHARILRGRAVADLADEIDRVRGLDAQDLRDLAERCIEPDRLAIVAVGPAAELRPKLASLGKVVEVQGLPSKASTGNLSRKVTDDATRSDDGAAVL